MKKKITVKAFKGMCTNCERRGTCTKLCTEARAYVDQDTVSGVFTQVGRAPLLMSNDAITALEQEAPMDSIWDLASSGKRTARQQTRLDDKIEAFRLSREGKTTREIAELVSAQKSQVAQWLKEMRTLYRRAIKDKSLIAKIQADRLEHGEEELSEIEEVFQAESNRVYRGRIPIRSSGMGG